MKKSSMALAAISLFALSACGMHNNDQHPPMSSNDMQHHGWDHKEHMRMMAEDMFNAIDKNGDGVITKKEFDAYFHHWFKQADVNGDGSLTFEEFKAQMHREKEKMKSQRSMHHDDMQDRPMDQNVPTNDNGNEEQGGQYNNDRPDGNYRN